MPNASSKKVWESRNPPRAAVIATSSMLTPPYFVLGSSKTRNPSTAVFYDHPTIIQQPRWIGLALLTDRPLTSLVATDEVALLHLDVIGREDAVSLPDHTGPNLRSQQFSRWERTGARYIPPVVLTVRLLQYRDDLSLLEAQIT